MIQGLVSPFLTARWYFAPVTRTISQVYLQKHFFSYVFRCFFRVQPSLTTISYVFMRCNQQNHFFSTIFRFWSCQQKVNNWSSGIYKFKELYLVPDTCKFALKQIQKPKNWIEAARIVQLQKKDYSHLKYCCVFLSPIWVELGLKWFLTKTSSKKTFFFLFYKNLVQTMNETQMKLFRLLYTHFKFDCFRIKICTLGEFDIKVFD